MFNANYACVYHDSINNLWDWFLAENRLAAIEAPEDEGLVGEGRGGNKARLDEYKNKLILLCPFYWLIY